MTVRKLSIPVPAEIEETIKAAAAEEGKPVSAWLAEAATERLAPLPSTRPGAPLPASWWPSTKPGTPLPEASRQRAPPVPP
jgi:hypothetical protein